MRQDRRQVSRVRSPGAAPNKGTDALKKSLEKQCQAVNYESLPLRTITPIIRAKENLIFTSFQDAALRLNDRSWPKAEIQSDFLNDRVWIVSGHCLLDQK